MAAGRLRADVKRAALALQGPLRGAAINLTGQQRPDWGGGLCYDLITLITAQVVI